MKGLNTKKDHKINKEQTKANEKQGKLMKERKTKGVPSPVRDNGPSGGIVGYFFLIY